MAADTKDLYIRAEQIGWWRQSGKGGILLLSVQKMGVHDDWKPVYRDLDDREVESPDEH